MGYECVIKFVPLSSIRRNTIVKIYLLHVEDLQLLQRAGFLVFCSIARIQSLHVFKALALLLKHLGGKKCLCRYHRPLLPLGSFASLLLTPCLLSVYRLKTYLLCGFICILDSYAAAHFYQRAWIKVYKAMQPLAFWYCMLKDRGSKLRFLFIWGIILNQGVYF